MPHSFISILLGILLGLITAWIFPQFPAVFCGLLGAILGYLWGQQRYMIQLVEKLNSEAITRRPERMEVKENHTLDKVEETTSPSINPAEVSPQTDKFEQWVLSLWSKTKNYFTTGNLPIKFGVVIFLFGIGFLVQYTNQLGLLTVKVRFIGAAILAILFCLAGFLFIIRKRREYGLSLLGLGLAINYLILFLAHQLYHFISPSILISAVLTLSVFIFYLSIRLNSLILAMIGLLGGYLAPYFSAFEVNSAMPLFYFYYALINSLVLVISYYRNWIWLANLGFWFTFILAAIWGYYVYQPADYLMTQLALAYFFGIYLVLNEFRFHRYHDQLQLNNISLLLGVPLFTIVLQAALTQSFAHGVALSSFVMAAIYFILGFFWGRKDPYRDLIRLAYQGLAFSFSILFVAYLFDAKITIAIASLEAAVIVWLGYRQEKALFSLLGAAILGVTFLFLIALIWQPDFTITSHSILTWPTDDLSRGINLFIYASAAFFSSYYFNRHFIKSKNTLYKNIANILFLIAALSWFSAGTILINRYLKPYQSNADLLFISLSSCLAWQLHKTIRWDWLRELALAAIVLGIVFYFQKQFLLQTPRVDLFNLGSWAFSFVVLYYFLFQNEKLDQRYLTLWHAFAYLAFTMIILLLSFQFLEQKHINFDYTLLLWLFELNVLLLLILAANKASYWPFKYQFYLDRIALAVVAINSALLLTVSVGLSGDNTPIKYLPIFNIYDLNCMMALLVLSVWIYRVKSLQLIQQQSFVYWMLCFGLIYFIVLNAILIRSVHHLMNIPFEWHALWQSAETQTTLSIFWSLLALMLMLIAMIKKSRVLWLTAIGVCVLVALKLFLLDLQNINIVMRIVSFMGVGAVFILMGYFSLSSKKG